MAIQCTLQIHKDYAEVKALNANLGTLKFDVSPSYCRIFETTKQQSRDYLEEMIRWCGERPDNLESMLKSIHLFLTVRRRELGMKK